MDSAKGCWGNDIGKLILRLTIGGLLLFHGVDKVTGVDKETQKSHFQGIKDAVVAHNMPEFVAYGVFIGEIAGPILVIAGLWTRIGAFCIAVDLIVAVALQHRDMLTAVNQGGGYALELQALYLFGALALLFMGGGRIGIGGLFSGSKAHEPAPVERQPVR